MEGIEQLQLAQKDLLFLFPTQLHDGEGRYLYFPKYQDEKVLNSTALLAERRIEVVKHLADLLKPHKRKEKHIDDLWNYLMQLKGCITDAQRLCGNAKEATERKPFGTGDTLNASVAARYTKDKTVERIQGLISLLNKHFAEAIEIPEELIALLNQNIAEFNRTD